MLCDICKANEATVHLTQIINGKMKKVDLCETCSKEKGVQDPAGFSLADLLVGIGTTEEMEARDKENAIKCPVCEFTLADFKKTGRLGCSSCYDTFDEGLVSVLKAMHKGCAHKGKVPRVLIAKIERAQKISDLKKNLSEAVREEKYELAAQLRDEIQKIEKLA